MIIGKCFNVSCSKRYQEQSNHNNLCDCCSNELQLFETEFKKENQIETNVFSIVLIFFLLLFLFMMYKASETGKERQIENQNKIAKTKNDFASGKEVFCSVERRYVGILRTYINNKEWELSDEKFLHPDGRYFNVFECSK